MAKQANRKAAEPRARKRQKERAIRHASRISRPKPSVIRNGRPLGDLDDERAWLDW